MAEKLAAGNIRLQYRAGMIFVSGYVYRLNLKVANCQKVLFNRKK